MKKITLNETDLLKIVNKVLNEQKIRKFDENELDLLHLIFERELKPPFRKGESGGTRYYHYYNRDGEQIGYLASNENAIMVKSPFLHNIKSKVCQVFQFSYDTWRWWHAIKPQLKSWLEVQLNIELRDIG